MLLEFSMATQFKKLPHGKIKMRLLCARRYICFLGFHTRRWKQEFIKLHLCHFSYLLLVSSIVLCTKCVYTWHWRTQQFFDPTLRSPLSKFPQSWHISLASLTSINIFIHSLLFFSLLTSTIFRTSSIYIYRSGRPLLVFRLTFLLIHHFRYSFPSLILSKYPNRLCIPFSTFCVITSSFKHVLVVRNSQCPSSRLDDFYFLFVTK